MLKTTQHSEGREKPADASRCSPERSEPPSPDQISATTPPESTSPATMGTDRVPPLVSAQLNYLLTHCPLDIKVEQMWSGGKKHALNDRLTLLIPFCLDFIRWDIVYESLYPLTPPDVIFGVEDEDFRPYHGVTGDEKNALSDWDSTDRTRLLTLVLELRNAYSEYHKKRAGEVEDERLKFELSTMISREGIEMCMSSGLDKPEEVKFSVPLLELDLNTMVVGATWNQPQKIYLQVIFPIVRTYSAKPSVPRLKLVSSPELKSWFSVDDFRLPVWMDGMCMAEYLPKLESQLEDQIKEAVSSIETRRDFITALSVLFGRPVEADSVFCRKVAYLATSGTFVFMVHFSVPLQFPKQQPAMILISSQHFNSQCMPITSPLISDYPWSPRWETSEMAERLHEFLADECVNFKRFCSDAR